MHEAWIILILAMTFIGVQIINYLLKIVLFKATCILLLIKGRYLTYQE